MTHNVIKWSSISSVVLIPACMLLIGWIGNDISTEVKTNTNKISQVCDRVTKIETKYQEAIPRMQEDIKRTADGVQEIKQMLYKTIMEKKHEREIYGINR